MILRYMEGPRSGKTIKINRGDFTIGRDDSCDFLLDEDGVSRLHCRIEGKDGAYTLKDNDSTNGIYLNGTKVGEPQILKQNDTIRIGDTILLFSSDENKLDSQVLESIESGRDEKGGTTQDAATDTPPSAEEAKKDDDGKESENEPTEKASSPGPDETQDHKPGTEEPGEVELNFSKDKTVNEVDEVKNDDTPSSLLSGSTGVMVAVVVILILILLYVLFGP
jgi:pSer/pThr/pTyr-binding forkhead associated (FHA) protein